MSQTRSPSLWRHADFLKLWSGQTVSRAGTQVSQLALPLVAIKVLDASAFLVGLLAAAETAPFLLVGLPAGVWVDRLRRRPVLITADVGRGVLLASIPVTYATGHLTILQLCLVAFLVGVLTVFFDVAYQSYLPSLVDRQQLIEGNSKLELSSSAAQIAGPGIAGLLLQALRAPVAIIVDAVSYGVSAVAILGIRRHEPPVAVPQDGRRRSMRRDIAEGLRFVLGHRQLRLIACCTATSNLWGAIGFAIFILFAVRDLGLGAGMLGAVFAVGAIGFPIAAVLAGRLSSRFGLGHTILGAILVCEAGPFLIAGAPVRAPVPFLMTGELLMGMGSVIYNINQVSLRQAIAPTRIQGRMNATMRFIVWGTMPIGGVIGGALATSIGLRPTMVVSALGGLLCIIPVALPPVRTLQRIPSGEELEALHLEEPVLGQPMAAVEEAL